MNASAKALPPLPGEHIEAIQVDLSTREGAVVIVEGRVSVWKGVGRMFVEVGVVVVCAVPRGRTLGVSFL